MCVILYVCVSEERLRCFVVVMCKMSAPCLIIMTFLCGLNEAIPFWQVMYVEGTAVIMGFEDPMLQTDDTPIKRCLQTKWPYIELLWATDRSPSLN